MTVLQAIILGLTQGLTEFAPISSSGHLILVPWLFEWDIVNDVALNKTFDVALHMGTLLGAVAYFRRDLWRYLVAWVRSIRARSISTMDQRLAWALVLGTIPGAFLGAVFEGPIQEHLGEPLLIAVMLAVFGVVLWWVDARSRSDRGFDSIGLTHGGRAGHRPRPGPAARRLTVGHHHDGRAMDRARPRVRGAILVPARDPDHRRCRSVQGRRPRPDGVPGLRIRSSSGGSWRRR